MAEKRLIDANAVLKWLEEITDPKEWMVSQYNADWIWSMVDSHPTVDAVEVVRCKDCKHYDNSESRKEKRQVKKVWVYYKEQCDYCTRKGKCDYEKKTRAFCETLGGVESLAGGVFGSLSFKCDYFDLDNLVYEKKHLPESCG